MLGINSIVIVIKIEFERTYGLNYRQNKCQRRLKIAMIKPQIARPCKLCSHPNRVW